MRYIFKGLLINDVTLLTLSVNVLVIALDVPVGPDTLPFEFAVEATRLLEVNLEGAVG